MSKNKTKLEYKGFTGSIKYHEGDGTFYGIVENLDCFVSYEGDDKEDLEISFKLMINDYLDHPENYK